MVKSMIEKANIVKDMLEVAKENHKDDEGIVKRCDDIIKLCDGIISGEVADADEILEEAFATICVLNIIDVINNQSLDLDELKKEREN